MRNNLRLRVSPILAIITSLGLSCGQDPAFLDVEHGKSENASFDEDSIRNADATASDGSDIDDFGTGDGGVLGGVIGKGPKSNSQSDDDDNDNDNDGNGNNNGGTNSGGNNNGNNNNNNNNDDDDDIVIPGVDPEDMPAIKRCLAKWGNNPFPNTITNVKKMVAVNVGGYGVPINDTQRTAQPMLTLIYASVNVGGAVTYNFMNPNGYYCMIVNVNVETDLDINLHCNARLSDSLVGVNVGSTMNGDVARIGVSVNSTVTINTARPAGDECIR